MKNANIGLKYVVVLLLFILLTENGLAEDTIPMSLEEVEKKFIENNYFLLASKYNIEAEKALIIQQKLFNNPTFSYEQNIYNPNNARYFDASRNGQFIAQVDKLFLMAGKRNKSIKLSEINYQMAELEFQDLIRTLKFELRSTLR